MSKKSEKNSLIDDLISMGIVEGDHLALGVSLKSLGIKNQAAETLLSALQAAVGSSGTLVVPAFTRACSNSEFRVNAAPIFDRDLSRAYTGQFSEFMRSHAGALRSSHPTNSVVALGAEAECITRVHDESAPAYSPYSTLATLGGKSLCIGIGDTLVGLRHQAQFDAGLLTAFRKSMGCGVQRGGKTEWFERSETSGCVTKLPRLVEEMRAHGRVVDGHLLSARSCVVQIPYALDYMTDRLKNDPAAFLCSNTRCLWCRETERVLQIGDREALFKINSTGLSRLFPLRLRNFYVDSRNRAELADSLIIAKLRAWKSALKW